MDPAQPQMADSQWQMANVEAHKEFARPAQTVMYSRTARQRPDPTSFMRYTGYMSYMRPSSLRGLRKFSRDPANRPFAIGHLPSWSMLNYHPSKFARPAQTPGPPVT